MKSWMKSDKATKDVISSKWGHGTIVSDNREGCRIVFDGGRDALLSFSYYADKGELYYVYAQDAPTVITCYDLEEEGYGRDDEYLYHLTSLENMDSILTRGLLSRAQLHNGGTEFNDIADCGIIGKRGYLEHFVPFHFVPDTAFDWVVKHGHPNTQFIYICISREYAKNRDSLVLPSHPTSNYAIAPLSYEYGMTQLDWDAIEDPYACRTNERKQRKMAECIVPEPVKAEDFARIIVTNTATAHQIYALYKSHGIACDNVEFLVDARMV